MSNKALRELMQKRAASVRKQEAQWVNPNAVSVHAIVEGFVSGKGKLCVTKEKALALGAVRPKIRLTILDVEGVKEREGETRKMKDNPLGIEVRGKVCVADVAVAFIRGGEGAIASAKKEQEDEKNLLDGMNEEDKKAYRIEKNEKRAKTQAAEPVIWHSVVPGLVFDINVFNTAKVTGMKAGSEVSIEGLSFKGSVWLKEPRKNGFGNNNYSVQFSVFWNFSTLSFIKQHKSYAHLYEKIPSFSNIDPYPEMFDLKFDLTNGDDKEPYIFELKDQEFARCVRIPLRLSFKETPNKGKKRRGVVGTLMPNESTDDFRAEKKETDADRAKRAATNEGEDMEEEESHYIQLKSRMSVVPYQTDVMKELEDGETLVYNVVVQINNDTVMRETGITRERYFTPVMEAISQSLEWEVIGSFNSSGTMGNKFNIGNIPQTTGCAGNIIHRARVASCRFEKFLLERAFHPSNDFVKEHFKKYMEFITKDVGYLNLLTANPHVHPNPMIQRYTGNLPTNRLVVPLFCLNESAQNYLKPNDFTICAVTSTWFAEASKRSEEGMFEQHQILWETGKLSQEEADKCLRNESDAVFPVGEDPVILVYAVRNLSGTVREFGGDENSNNEEDSDKENEDSDEELVRPPKFRPVTRSPPIKGNRDTGAMDIDGDE